jgi:hypothetical protein
MQPLTGGPGIRDEVLPPSSGPPAGRPQPFGSFIISQYRVQSTIEVQLDYTDEIVGTILVPRLPQYRGAEKCEGALLTENRESVPT